MKKFLYILLWSISILGVFLYTQLPADFDIDITGFGSENDQSQRQELLSGFNSWDTTMVIMVEKTERFQSYADILAWNACTDTIATWPEVQQLISLTDFDFPVYQYYYPQVKPFLPLSDSLAFTQAWTAIDAFPDITEKFLAENRQLMALYVYPASDIDQTALAEKIQHLLETEQPAYQVHFMGFSLAEAEMEAAVQNDLLWVTGLAIVLLFIGYMLLTRAWRSLLFLLTFVVFSATSVFSIMYLCGYTLTMLSSAVPAIVAILSFSDIMHVLSHYRHLLDQGLDAAVARKKLFRVIGLPMLLTSLSNLVGFLFFLVIGDSAYIIEVAVVATLGIVLTYITARFLVPRALTPSLTAGLLQREEKVGHRLQIAQEHVQQYRANYVTVLAGFTILLAFLVWKKNPVNMSYYDARDDNQTYVQSFMLFDQYFQGVRDIEVVLETDMDKMDSTLLQSIEVVESYLLDSYGCRSTYSWNTILKRYNRYLHQGKAAHYSLPDTRSQKLRDELEQQAESLGVGDVVGRDGQQFRIIGNLPDIGTREGIRRNQALDTFLSSSLPKGITYQLSGEAIVFDSGVQSFTYHICIALLLTLMAIAFLMGYVARSAWVALLCFWLNLLPLLIAIGVMQLMGVALNPQSVFLLSVILGVALDDSIYVVGFYSSLKRSSKLFDFREQVLRHMGFPVWVTTAVLAISFLALSFSSNHLLAAFGVVTSVSLLTAFIFDILLLPIIMSKGK